MWRRRSCRSLRPECDETMELEDLPRPMCPSHCRPPVLPHLSPCPRPRHLRRACRHHGQHANPTLRQYRHRHRRHCPTARHPHHRHVTRPHPQTTPTQSSWPQDQHTHCTRAAHSSSNQNHPMSPSRGTASRLLRLLHPQCGDSPPTGALRRHHWRSFLPFVSFCLARFVICIPFAYTARHCYHLPYILPSPS